MAATSFFGGEFFGGEFFNTPAPPIPVSTGGGVPGRTLYPRDLDRRARYESENDKLARRIRDGILPAPAREITPVREDEYTARSATLAAGISRFRAEAEASRREIARLEAELERRQSEILAREILRIRQALQLAMLQEAALIEEMEVLDVAYIASVVIGIAAGQQVLQ